MGGSSTPCCCVALCKCTQVHRVPDLAQVRDLYWTARNFRNRVADFLRYRRVTANMDTRFADATEADLARADGEVSSAGTLSCLDCAPFI